MARDLPPDRGVVRPLIWCVGFIRFRLWFSLTLRSIRTAYAVPVEIWCLVWINHSERFDDLVWINHSERFDDLVWINHSERFDDLVGLVFEYIYNLSAPCNTSAVYIYLRSIFTAEMRPLICCWVSYSWIHHSERFGVLNHSFREIWCVESIIPRDLVCWIIHSERFGVLN